MRVLFSTTAGAGHFGPAVPVARACLDAGHEVVVAAPESFGTHVRGLGFAHAALPDVPSDQLGAVFGRLPSLSHEEANRVVVTEVFGRLDAQAAYGPLLDLITAWQPDVVLRDPVEFGSLMAAIRCRVPQVQVAIGLGDLTTQLAPWLDEPLRELAVIAGVDPEPGADRLRQTPTMSSVPPSLDGPPDPRSAEVWRFGVPLGVSTPSLPGTWGDPEHPLLYVSYGSVAGGLGPFREMYRRTLEALADQPVRVLMTTGAELDQDAVGPVPTNTWVAPWWPQEAVMAEAAAVIGHGGFGTTMIAMRAGVPQIVLPLFSSDQFHNAEQIAAVGAGLALSDGPGSLPSLPDVVATILGEETYAAVARGLAAEAAAMPDVRGVVERLEQLAAR